jgi:hypothetical protein
LKSTPNETCAILTLATSDAQIGVDNFKNQYNRTNDIIITLPLVDMMKIHSGTVDEVSNLGWTVPYVHPSNRGVSHSVGQSSNRTEKMEQWERVLIVDFVPGLGGMKEESELLEVVNTIMSDIQDMGEAGWWQRLNDQERQAYEVDESLTFVPTISEMFSLTASTMLNGDGTIDKYRQHPNSRISFWKEAFEHGIESEHACGEMFSTLFVKARSGYYSYDLILNPIDGPPPNDYDSSASNPACVASLIAGLSIHREFFFLVKIPFSFQPLMLFSRFVLQLLLQL